MEELLKQLINSISDLKENVLSIKENIQNLEQRLDRFEKMDSIEHRVEVNQIDLSDIKDIVEKMENFQRDEVLPMAKAIKDIRYGDEITLINKRLDAQLTKIAKNEEAIIMITETER